MASPRKRPAPTPEGAWLSPLVHASLASASFSAAKPVAIEQLEGVTLAFLELLVEAVKGRTEASRRTQPTLKDALRGIADLAPEQLSTDELVTELTRTKEDGHLRSALSSRLATVPAPPPQKHQPTILPLPLPSALKQRHQFQHPSLPPLPPEHTFGASSVYPSLPSLGDALPAEGTVSSQALSHLTSLTNRHRTGDAVRVSFRNLLLQKATGFEDDSKEDGEELVVNWEKEDADAEAQGRAQKKLKGVLRGGRMVWDEMGSTAAEEKGIRRGTRGAMKWSL